MSDEQEPASADEQPEGTDPPGEDTHGPEDGAQDATGDEQPDEDADAPEGEGKRKLRRRAQDAEARAERLQTALDARDTTDVERHASARLVDGSELWQATTLADLRGDDGGIEVERIDAAVDELIARKPYLANKDRVPRGRRPDPAKDGRQPGGESFATGWQRFLGARDDRR